ncbi:carbohydrate sulfotransferase 3 [Elysia marginata]|uniref:Carbohydrate sulfotransferase 3 n=1 Tax=Elysia marginata TaxID=1093978 RepID=A0AAV4JY43_9GAST|nr:carbohydrate sulfotransferase 3 [Elysia marginata]
MSSTSTTTIAGESLHLTKEKRNYPTHNIKTIDGQHEIRDKLPALDSDHLGLGLDNNQSSLLLVTMGRSGSTFTSAIISHHEDVFYTSEPLHAVGKDIYSEVISLETTQKAQDAVDAFLTCDFRKMDSNLFRSKLFLNSKSTENIYKCLQSQKSSSYDYVACFITLMHQCSQKRLHFVKTIRYRLEWVRGAMRRNPKLKVLFLVRDFRATLYSQAATFETFNMTIDGERRARLICASLETNARELETLLKLYRGRIRVIRYEDGCLNPVAYAKNIYSFAGLQFSKATEAYIKSITQSKKSEKFVSDKFKVERSNAVETMNKWRHFANFNLVQKIDRVCAKADVIFGYKPVKSAKQLQSNNFSLIKNPNLSKGLYHFVTNRLQRDISRNSENES